MNNKELATGVLKHPLIQEIIRRQIVGSSVINHLIVEEVLSELRERNSQQILATTIEKMQDATDEQIKNYVSAAENKINVQAILKAIEDIEALTNPNTGFQESETELLNKFASAAANVEQFGFDDVISEWIKAQIAAKAAVPLATFVARIPVAGWLTAAASAFNIRVEEWAITKLLFPVDLLVDSIWKGIGAKDAEDLIGQVMGREVYEKIVEASPNKAKILEVLKTVDYKKVMAQMLLLAKDSDNVKIQEKYEQLANMKIKDYPIGQWIIKAVLGDELPDPGKEADTTTDTETTTDTPTDTETDGTEDEETDPTATTLKLAFSEKQNEDWLTASRDFEKNFLKVPWLRMQQDIMIKLLDAINGLNNELESLSSRRDELDEAEDSGVDKAALKKIRSDLRYIERKIKEIKSSLRGFLDKSSTTRRGESVKKELVRSINELQISIAKTYEDFGRLAPVELDEALDPEETKEQKIEKVEGVYDRVVPLIRQLNTIMNKSNDSGKFVNIESEIKRELESITKYFPSTAKFMPSATQGTKEAVIGFVKAIEMFRKDELVEIYSLTSEGQITPRLIKDAKTALQNLSDTIESLLGVDSRIPASEAVVVSDDEESFVPAPAPDSDDGDEADPNDPASDDDGVNDGDEEPTDDYDDDKKFNAALMKIGEDFWDEGKSKEQKLNNWNNEMNPYKKKYKWYILQEPDKPDSWNPVTSWQDAPIGEKPVNNFPRLQVSYKDSETDQSNPGESDGGERNLVFTPEVYQDRWNNPNGDFVLDYLGVSGIKSNKIRSLQTIIDKNELDLQEQLINKLEPIIEQMLKEQ